MRAVYLILAAILISGSFSPAFADSVSSCNSVMSGVWLVMSVLSFMPFAAIFQILGKWEVSGIVRVVLGMVAASLVLLVGIQFVASAAAQVNCGQLTPTPPPVIALLDEMNVRNSAVNRLDGQPQISSIHWSQTVDSSYFAYHVWGNGTLRSTGGVLNETLFIQTAHANGATVSFSVGGSSLSQNATDAYNAVVNNPVAFSNSINSKITSKGYDAVKIDIEDANTITGAQMLTFFTDLRVAIGNTKSIYIDVQTYEANTVWSQMASIEPLVQGIFPMLYDESGVMPGYPTKLAYVQARMAIWTPKVNTHYGKLYPGMAISGQQYEDYTISDVTQVAAWSRTQSFGGNMIWNNLYMNNTVWAALNQ